MIIYITSSYSRLMGVEYRTSDDFKDSKAKPLVVVGTLIYYEDDILLVTAEKFKGKWVLVGGHLDFGESIDDCAIREAKEETGLDVTDPEFMLYIESIGSGEFTMKKHFVFMNFSVRALSKEVKLSDELTDFRWIPRSKVLSEDLNASTRKTVEKFLSQ